MKPRRKAQVPSFVKFLPRQGSNTDLFEESLTVRRQTIDNMMIRVVDLWIEQDFPLCKQILSKCIMYMNMSDIEFEECISQKRKV